MLWNWAFSNIAYASSNNENHIEQMHPPEFFFLLKFKFKDTNLPPIFLWRRHPFNCTFVFLFTQALQFVELNARDLGIKKHKRLAVSGAFHTELMRPAQMPLAKALKAVHVMPPRIMTHSNLDGAAYRTPEEIRRKLEAQLCEPVKWEQLMQQIYNRDVGEEFPRTFECGPGSSLRTVLKMVNGKAWNVSESISA